MRLQQIAGYVRDLFLGQSRSSVDKFSHIQTAYDFYHALATTDPQSDERRDMLRYVLSKHNPRIMTGANVSNISPDGKCVVVLNQRINRSGELDGLGPEGGLSDPGEHPLMTALREMIEERCDRGVIVLPPDYKNQKEREKFIKERVAEFANSIGLNEETLDRERVARQLELMKHNEDTINIFDEIFNFSNIQLAPQPGVIDLSFMMGVTPENNSQYFEVYNANPERLKTLSIGADDCKESCIRFTSPFQFLRFHTSWAEFDKLKECATRSDLAGEVGGTVILRWEEVAENIIFEGEDRSVKKMRYSHEALGILWGVIYRGGATADKVIARLRTNMNKLAVNVNSSPEEIEKWLRSAPYGQQPAQVPEGAAICYG